MDATFLGIDLAWRSERNPSGGVALREESGVLHLVQAAPPLRSLDAVQQFITAHAADECVVAIDGPLVIPNLHGQRTCELDLSRRYGARHASCHSSNQSLYPDAASVRLADWLSSLGFSHGDASSSSQRAMIEVYPHAAYIALFDLPSIIRYKKGTCAEKGAGLRVVQQTLAKLPFHRDAAIDELLAKDPSSMRGQARKDFEDLLDALFCAYLAYHFARHRHGWEFFGTTVGGYIANPSLPLSELVTLAA